MLADVLLGDVLERKDLPDNMSYSAEQSRLYHTKKRGPEARGVYGYDPASLSRDLHQSGTKHGGTSMRRTP
jgi:hypothetical protein